MAVWFMAAGGATQEGFWYIFMCTLPDLPLHVKYIFEQSCDFWFIRSGCFLP